METLKIFFNYLLHSAFMGAVFSLSINVVAEELSSVNTEAMNKTVNLLNSKVQREAAIKGNKQAEKANQMAKQLFGEGKDLDKAYAAAAKLFESMTKSNGGDSTAMMQNLMKAQQNPEAFFKTLTPEQKAMIQDLGKTAEQRRSPAAPN